MTDRVPLTSSGRRHLESDATRLEARIAELRELLEDARADRTADDDERAAALGLLDEHARLEVQLSELRIILESTLDAPPVSTDVVGLGTSILVRNDDGSKETFILVDPAEGAPGEGRISVHSPLGAALLGLKPGDKATVAAPSGSWQVEVIKIEAAL